MVNMTTDKVRPRAVKREIQFDENSYRSQTLAEENESSEAMCTF